MRLQTPLQIVAALSFLFSSAIRTMWICLPSAKGINTASASAPRPMIGPMTCCMYWSSMPMGPNRWCMFGGCIEG